MFNLVNLTEEQKSEVTALMKLSFEYMRDFVNAHVKQADALTRIADAMEREQNRPS